MSQTLMFLLFMTGELIAILMPRLQDALDNATPKPAEPAVSYKPGLDRR
jgi:hypothetical protein